MRRILSVSLALLLSACSASPLPERADTTRRAGPATAQRLTHPASRAALADTLRRSLKEELLAPWYPRAVDRTSGGYLSQFDFEWKPMPQQNKMIVTQARHVWTTARAAQFFPDDTVYPAAAAHGFRFLRDRMWDREHGGFFWLVTREGEPQAERGGALVKRAYGQAFAIYALAAYFDQSRDSSALRLAQEAFRWLDRHAHDPVHRGYFDFMARDGSPMRAGMGGTPPKDQNSSIHLLEAFTELYRVWPDPVLRERLREMLVLIRDTIVTEPGTLTLYSAADWTPVSYRDSSEASRRANRYARDHVSFGHDVETAYLMLEASHALGLGDDPATHRVSKRMLDHALRTGFDTVSGGFYEAGYYHRGRTSIEIVDGTKNWWAQAEGLNTLLQFAELHPNDPLRYGDRFLLQWRYITTNLIDHARGGWYEGGLDRQPEMRLAPKGHIWKAAYHDGRALMNVVRRLERAP